MIAVRTVRHATATRPAQLVVSRNGVDIGVLEKYRDTQDTKHPWKAFKGIGMECAFVAAFYEKDGGKRAALSAITGEPA